MNFSLRFVAATGLIGMLIADDRAKPRNGIRWNTQKSNTQERLLQVIFTGTAFMAVGRGGVLTSTNGSRWEPQ